MIGSTSASAGFFVLAGVLCFAAGGAMLIMYRYRMRVYREGEPLRWGQNPAIPARAWPAAVGGLIMLAIGIARFANRS